MITVEVGSAITVLNAIATGIGAAIGTTPTHRITVKRSENMIVDTGNDTDLKLVDECLELMRTQFGIEDQFRIDMNIIFPPARGMKTSSIASVGLVSAFNSMYNLELSTSNIIGLSASASINAGVSITGAMDDAYAVSVGGYWITDNLERKVLFTQDRPDMNENVIFAVPLKSIPKASIKIELDSEDQGVLEEAKKKAISGNWREAIRLNTSVYAAHLLSENIPSELSRLTGSTVGINGAGPSVFVLSQPSETEKIQSQLKDIIPDYNLTVGGLRV